MRTVLSLKVEIRNLMKDLATNTMNIRLSRENPDAMHRFLLVRTEIYKSIAHRQGLIIEVLSVEVKFNKVA